MMPRFIKVSAAGVLLAREETDWDGVYIPAAELTVARHPTATRGDFKQANDACRALSFAGGLGDRSISLREFVNHLLEDDRIEPCVEPEFFTVGDPHRWIWTSDACAPAGCAWAVNLYGGGSGRSRQGNRYSALAVRVGQHPGLLAFLAATSEVAESVS